MFSALSASDGVTVATALSSAMERLGGSSETARLDAELLLARALNRDRSHLRAWPQKKLSPDEQERFHTLVEQRRNGIPVAYLFGEKEFWSRAFEVSPDVLIPRPETELLVELALAALPTPGAVDVLDLGTGSGAIAVSIAAERPLARVTATDLSPGALKIAQKNAVRHGIRNIRFRLGDWFDAIACDQRFDLIVSNPPYVADDDPHLNRGDVRFEPSLALKGGRYGLDALRIIARDARYYLKPHGQLMLEHGFDQAKPLTDLLNELGYAEISRHADLQGHFRVTTARWEPSSHPFRNKNMHDEEIHIPRPLVNQLLHYAQTSPDVEVCGLIGAKDGTPSRCYPVKNASATPDCRFQMEPHEQIEAMRKMRERGEELFAIFHSHPAAPAEPSAADLEQAAYPNALYIIISLNTKGVLEMRGFRINQALEIEEVALLL